MSEVLPGIRKLLASWVWAITPEYLEAIMDVLYLRSELHLRFPQEEIAARLEAVKHGALGKGQRIAPSSGDIAVIPIQGVIAQRAHLVNGMSGPGGTGMDALKTEFDAVMKDESVSAIVFDVDSPGGAIYGVQEMARHIASNRGTKRIVAVANAQMASAAYWLASAADEVVVTPSGEAGSIGVYTVHDDLSEALGREGRKQTVIKAGKYKAEGHPSAPLTDEARTAMQDRVNEAYGTFTADVAEYRGVKAADVRNGYGEGRILSAVKAKEAGVVDRIATLDDVISRLASPKGGPKPGTAKSVKSLRDRLELDSRRIMEGPATR